MCIYQGSIGTRDTLSTYSLRYGRLVEAIIGFEVARRSLSRETLVQTLDTDVCLSREVS